MRLRIAEYQFDDLIAGSFSIAEIRAIEDPFGSIFRSLSKLPRRSGHSELSQKPL
jgi:hypothetical protein